MLEPEEVDEDFFTPVSNASLSTIFKKKNQIDETDNDSLKYVAPKPVVKHEVKTTECIFACPIIGFEWYNNIYTPRGKIGFALINILKTDSYNIILYDTNKKTLSCTNVSSQFKITVKEDVYISYYDDNKKYWSLYGSPEQLKKVLDTLQNIGVTLQPNEIQPLPMASKEELWKYEQEKVLPVDTESDDNTSVSIPHKSKLSIISRMASMGQSVLPPGAKPTEKTSDTDSSDSIIKHKSSRHKVTRKATLIKESQEACSSSEVDSQESLQISSTIRTGANAGPVPNYSYVSQILPISNSHYSNDINALMAEQRSNNTEIRMNIGRLTDKVDQVINKINDIKEHQTQQLLHTPSMSKETSDKKLLSEYEHKIKMYEKIIMSNKLTIDEGFIYEVIKSKCEYDKQRDDTNIDNKLIIMQKEISHLKNKLEESEEKNNQLNKQITENTSIMESIPNNKALLEDMVKKILNDSFQHVTEKIEDDKNYSGNLIKSLLATAMKKVATDLLNKN